MSHCAVSSVNLMQDSVLNTQIQRQRRPNIEKMDRRSWSFNPLVDNEATGFAGEKKSILSTSNSLEEFFLSPESNGMKCDEIVEYVIAYCERRASSSLSAGPNLEDFTPNVNINAEKSLVWRESGTYFGNEGEMVTQSIAENVGSGEGYKKFKKNLHHTRKTETRYRDKLKHHQEFEKKRLYVDNHYSQVGSSLKTSKGMGLTASLERPGKNMFDSPPSKLLPNRRELKTGRREKPMRTNLFDIQEETEIAEKLQQRKEYNSSSHIQKVSCYDSQKMGAQDGHSELSKKELSNRTRHENHKESQLPVSAKRLTSISVDISKVLEHYNILPEGNSKKPVMHSELQQCSTGHPQRCPHHYGQQPSLNGMVPGRNPIVIHIHLPSSVSTQAHPHNK